MSLEKIIHISLAQHRDHERWNLHQDVPCNTEGYLDYGAAGIIISRRYIIYVNKS